MLILDSPLKVEFLLKVIVMDNSRRIMKFSTNTFFLINQLLFLLVIKAQFVADLTSEKIWSFRNGGKW